MLPRLMMPILLSLLIHRTLYVSVATEDIMRLSFQTLCFSFFDFITSPNNLLEAKRAFSFFIYFYEEFMLSINVTVQFDPRN